MSPGLIVQATTEQLKRHAPFDRMAAADLAFLVAGLKLAYFGRGRIITSSRSGPASTLYIVQRGLARGELEGGVAGQDRVEYGEGECFPLAAIMAERASVHEYRAVEDTFCFEAEAATVRELARRSLPFQEFCSNRAGVLLRQSYASLQALYAQQSTAEVSVRASLGELTRRAPLACRPDQSVRAAVQAMHAARVGSIIVTSVQQTPLGIFTKWDLVRLTAMGTFNLDLPVSAVMSSPAQCLPASAQAAEAAVLMARSGIRHVVVMEEGRVAGVVSERDLFALQRMSLHGIIDAIDAAEDGRALAHAGADIRRLASNLLAQGVGAEQLTQMIATLNDRLTGRLLSLESARHDLGGIRICWIALGSEGRLEQTLATDQDNGIIFSTNMAPSVARERLLPFAKAVNHALDTCGFPLCKGDIMAGNPMWCLSLDEWRQKFSAWIRDPLPSALLNASIFFDFRALWGEESLALDLRTWLAAEVRDDQRFLRAIAQGALESPPPLGLFTDFVTTDAEGAPDSVDLKTQGTRPFVDAARIFALASGGTDTQTALRLRSSGERLNVPKAETEAVVEAFHFILLFRLRHQQQDPAHANRIRPDALNELDRRILKEAFRQARKLQSRLALDYQL
jgi:CBS domain-containing protein